MDIVKIAGIGLVAAILARTVKNTNPNIGFQLSIAAGVLILTMICSSLPPVINLFNSFTNSAGISNLFIGVILKVIGISYITDLIAELCRDSEEKAIASKVELAGKISILIVAIPLFESVLKLFQQMIR